MQQRLSKLIDPKTPDGMEVYCLTYGEGSNLANCYSAFYARDIAQARKIAFETTKGKHAFLYEPQFWILDDGHTQAERYRLELVPLQPQKPKYLKGTRQ